MKKKIELLMQKLKKQLEGNKLYGLTERERFTLALKKLFEYEISCINIK